MIKEIFVFADWIEASGPKLMGTLTAELVRGKEIFSFEYDKAWLSSKAAQVLDPDLQLYSGPQYLNDQEKFNFGVFLDSSPDRWGRILMQRREAAKARAEARKPKKLFETDYLLGVYDGHRMGGLRFKTDIRQPFLSDDDRLASPPWTSIRELEQISLKLEEKDAVDDLEYIKWLDMLVNPGSSLGGARPKASVVDPENQLWIAKFPSKRDDSDLGAWEIVTYELAIKAGIEMAPCQARKFSTDHHTFLTKRFDRTSKNERIHFSSALTQLGYTDDMDAAAGASYLELAEFLLSFGAQVTKDLHQLWRRIVFSICISNTDDHLRNHGFLLTRDGWTLSPAYDLNPIATGTGLKLNISENDNALDLDLALELAPYFRVPGENANQIIQEVKTAVNQWSEIASKYGLSRSEQELKAPAFLAADT